MPIRADAKNLKVDAASRLNGAFVPRTLRVEVRDISMQEVHTRRIDVHSTEQVLLHEAAVAAGM
jgi:hypothetical protein